MVSFYIVALYLATPPDISLITLKEHGNCSDSMLARWCSNVVMACRVTPFEDSFRWEMR